MNKIFLSSLLCLALPAMFVAQNPDATWPLGINEYPNAGGYGNALVRFQGDSLKLVQTDLKMNFESSVGAVSDSLGNLLFYTNGCYIADASGDTMSNGDGLNPGLVHDWVCPENGYICPRGVMALPIPGSHNEYYVLHMGARYEAGKNLTYGPFYYSIVDMALNDGNGAVTAKNQVLNAGNLESFAVVRHGNGRDWWILAPEFHSNRYRRFLVGPANISELPPLEIGPVAACLRIGSTAFSPDGGRFARQQNCKTLVFDFDRCSGELSNPLELNRPEYAFGGGGVAFSPDGKRLFSTEQMAVLSAEISQPNPAFDTLVTTEAITGAGLQFMQYGPDGNSIYMNILHRSRFFSSLDSVQSAQPMFKQNSISLPVYSVRTLPYFPNFRLYDLPGSSCDTLGIDAPASVWQLAGENLVPFPNPASEIIYLSVETPVESIRVLDATGREIHTGPFRVSEGKVSINIGRLSPGLYYLCMRSEGKIWSGKFVKE